MNGLLYKYFRQNWIMVVLSAVAPSMIFVMFLLVFLLSSIGGGDFSFVDTFGMGGDVGNKMLTLLFLLIGYFIAQSLHSALLKNEEVKKWSYFTVSSPKGVKGVVYSRYLFIFMACGITFVTMTMLDALYVSIAAWCGSGDVNSSEMILIAAFFVELFILSIELVFNSRFGTVYGGHVKFALFVAGTLIFFIILLFVPLNNTDGIFDAVLGAIADLLEGNIPKWLYYAISAFPAVSILSYLLSYKISCKLYMKGVDGYEK